MGAENSKEAAGPKTKRGRARKKQKTNPNGNGASQSLAVGSFDHVGERRTSGSPWKLDLQAIATGHEVRQPERALTSLGPWFPKISFITVSI